MPVALTDRNKLALNLNGATVTLFYRRAGDSEWLSGACEVTDAALGHISGPDVALADVDNYEGYFVVDLGDGAPTYIPSRGYYIIEVEESAG